jgi:hypothetical protein
LIFSIVFWIQLGLSHPWIACIIWCVCTHNHWPYGYPHFTLCSWQQMHMNPWCSLWHLCCHCRGVDFYMGRKQLHAFPFNTFNLFCQQVNIVFTKVSRTLPSFIACIIVCTNIVAYIIVCIIINF